MYLQLYKCKRAYADLKEYWVVNVKFLISSESYDRKIEIYLKAYSIQMFVFSESQACEKRKLPEKVKSRRYI